MSSIKPLSQRILTVVSPFHELLCSVHVLNQPDHHPRRVNWSRALRPELPGSLLDTIFAIGKLTDGWTALLDLLREHAGPQTCADGIRRLRHLPDAELAWLLTGKIHPLDQVIGWLQGKDPEGMELAFAAAGGSWLHRIGAVRKQLADVLEACCTFYFSREWDYLEPWMNKAAAEFEELAAKGAEQALRTLHPRLVVENGVITAHKAVSYNFPLDQLQAIYVYPSAFIYPHLLIDWSPGAIKLPLDVNVPGWVPDEEPPRDLMLRLKVMSDPTRLKLIKLLWKEPHCTKQLAPALGISEAAVSKHLKLLTESGLAAPVRRGNYLFYAVNKKEVDMTTVLQRQFLEQ